MLCVKFVDFFVFFVLLPVLMIFEGVNSFGLKMYVDGLIEFIL